MKKINKTCVSAEEKNALYKAGYRYIAEGDYRITKGTDPWSGMPNTTNNIYAFTDKAEAEAFAVTQIWVFNPNIHATVEELPEHTETWDEFREKEAKKKAERKAREAAKAAEAGMTVEEYRAEKKRLANIKKIKKEIETLKAVLAKAEADLKKLEG